MCKVGFHKTSVVLYCRYHLLSKAVLPNSFPSYCFVRIWWYTYSAMIQYIPFSSYLNDQLYQKRWYHIQILIASPMRLCNEDVSLNDILPKSKPLFSKLYVMFFFTDLFSLFFLFRM